MSITMLSLVAYWFIIVLAILFIFVPFLKETALGAEDFTAFIPFGGFILGFLHAFVAVFSGWRGDRCQTKALDLTMKELEVQRASAQPHNVLSPSPRHDPESGRQ